MPAIAKYFLTEEVYGSGRSTLNIAVDIAVVV